MVQTDMMEIGVRAGREGEVHCTSCFCASPVASEIQLSLMAQDMITFLSSLIASILSQDHLTIQKNYRGKVTLDCCLKFFLYESILSEARDIY